MKNATRNSVLLYLTCPRYKGRPKKHISVCRKCPWNRKCIAYQRHLQPELPFKWGSEK